MKIKTLRAFIKKEFLHIFRDYRTLVVLFGMPLVQVILFGYAITMDLRDVKIAIWDKSKDNQSLALVENLTASGFFIKAGEINSPDEIEETFRKGKTRAVVVIPTNFNKKLSGNKAAVQIIADAADPNTANIVTNQLTGIISKWGLSIQKSERMPGGIITEVRMHYNPTMKSVFLFVPGVITIILMLVSAMLTSIAITREKEMGNMEILLVSPLKPGTVILGKIFPYLVLSLLNAGIIITIGQLVFGVPLRGSGLLLFSECLLFVIVSLSLGVFISTKAKNQQMALMMSLFALMMPTILLSGFIFPISSMPLPLQWLSHIMPPKYFIIILKTIMLKGLGLEVIWKETLILFGMALFFIALSIKNYKTRLA